MIIRKIKDHDNDKIAAIIKKVIIDEIIATKRYLKKLFIF